MNSELYPDTQEQVSHGDHEKYTNNHIANFEMTQKFFHPTSYPDD